MGLRTLDDGVAAYLVGWWEVGACLGQLRDQGIRLVRGELVLPYAACWSRGELRPHIKAVGQPAEVAQCCLLLVQLYRKAAI